MAEETTGDQQTQEPNGEAQQPETDWKTKYEETLAHSREWEKRAKANKTAADELQQLKESQMSEAQKAEARTARLQKELDQLKAEKQTNAWRSQVAEKSKLPSTKSVEREPGIGSSACARCWSWRSDGVDQTAVSLCVASLLRLMPCSAASRASFR